MSDLIEYIYLNEHDIHKFIWHDKSKQATIDYLEMFKDIHFALSDDDLTMRVLLDYTETGSPPFNSVAQSLEGFKPRTDVQIRVAHLYNDSTFPVMMQNIVMYNRIAGDRRFFKIDEIQAAIEWLCED